MKEAYTLLQELIHSINTYRVDIDEKCIYYLTQESHEIITKCKEFLYNKVVEENK